MTRAASLVRPPLLLLSLLWLLWAPSGAGTETIGVLAPAQVRGFLGDTTELPCKLQPLGHNVTVTQVTWTRQKLKEASRSVAVFHPTQGPSFPEPGRLEFVAARPGEELRDASLAVRGLRAEDEGNYSCQFATFPNGDRSARTWLRVLAQPQNKAETREIPRSQLSLEPVPVAHCISTGGRPPARISWSPPLDKMANTSQVPGPLPGTVTVISLLTLIPSSHVDGKNVTCRVEHESFEERVVLPMTLSVPYPPEVSISGYDGNWYIGRSEASLHCDVRSKPEPTCYNWNTTMGPLPPSVVAQGAQLLIHTVDESINTTFICLVTNALGTGQAEVTVLVTGLPREPSHSGASSGIIIILAFTITLVGLLLGLLIYFWKSRNFRWNQHSSSANGNVIYSAVGCNASSPQDPPTEGTR
ncbi:poliovirus receptor isoform X1 [Neophocaena asiaeorientalis asiaeorientalis]|uniref:Poliovirus receptor isoform X1 n=1 Tax=Neophocaena asiaeorientalis asiaeorientalis TaxID=1706337 RepID=A0A341D9Y6_NEOAA|nr:poliovirus receptor isoform X1 [Neophocaena asiaeorientalis asiaeorientalis]